MRRLESKEFFFGLSQMVRLCHVIGLVIGRRWVGDTQRRLVVEMGSQSTDLMATHRRVSEVTWYFGS